MFSDICLRDFCFYLNTMEMSRIENLDRIEFVLLKLIYILRNVQERAFPETKSVLLKCKQFC